MICNTLKSLEDEDERKIDWTTIKKFLRILCVILIIYTTLYITFFKCFLVLNNSITRAPQTVTLSSEGPANEMYPDSMGEYQLAEEVIQGWDADYTWYRHKEREDRFLMYNNLGNILSIFLKNISYLYTAKLCLISAQFIVHSLLPLQCLGLTLQSDT